MTTEPYRPGRGRKGPGPETVRRIEAINALHAEGRSFAAIARELGISRQRIHQIVNREPDGSVYRWALPTDSPFKKARSLR